MKECCCSDWGSPGSSCCGLKWGGNIASSGLFIHVSLLELRKSALTKSLVLEVKTPKKVFILCQHKLNLVFPLLQFTVCLPAFSLSFLPSSFKFPFSSWLGSAWLKKGDLNLNTLFGFIRLTTVELTTTTVDSSRAIRNVQHLSNKVYLHRL